MTTTTQGGCPCGELPSSIAVTTRDDDAITYDDVQIVRGRCRLCGNKFELQLVPNDYTVNGDPA
ncbi:MAG TPA: hypothetical protein VIO32_09795, partial [Candidatus Baltobacteraceae bacterium]